MHTGIPEEKRPDYFDRLQELIGYENFFIWVMVCCTATIAVCAFIKIDPNYGKKAEGIPQKTK